MHWEVRYHHACSVYDRVRERVQGVMSTQEVLFHVAESKKRPYSSLTQGAELKTTIMSKNISVSHPTLSLGCLT